MKKIIIITCWFEWTWWGKIASLLENHFSKSYETVTLVWFYDKNIFPIKWKKYSLWAFGKESFPWRSYIGLLPHLYNTMKYIYKEKPDAVVCIGTYCNFLWLIANIFLKFKLLLTQHEHITTQKKSASLLDKLIIYIVGKLINWNIILAVSNVVKDDLIKSYHLEGKNVITIYNWLNIQEIIDKGSESLKSADDFLVTIWSLDDNKNQELIIRAYNNSILNRKYALYIIGEWPKEQYLKDLILQLKLTKRVKLFWYQSNPYKFLARAKWFCFASKSESFGLVLAEALLFWLPIISTPIPSAEEVLNNGKYWLITKDYSIAEYTKNLNLMVNKSREKKELYIKYVQTNFSLEKMTSKYEEVLNKLLS